MTSVTHGLEYAWTERPQDSRRHVHSNRALEDSIKEQPSQVKRQPSCGLTVGLAGRAPLGLSAVSTVVVVVGLS